MKVFRMVGTIPGMAEFAISPRVFQLSAMLMLGILRPCGLFAKLDPVPS